MANLPPNRSDSNHEGVSLDKTADILQATFAHYYQMALDHHTKAATISTILLIIVAAIIGLVGIDDAVGGAVDALAGLAVFSLGVFGAVWAWKQHERYHYWEHIATEYQRELSTIVPLLKPREAYHENAQQATAQEFSPLFAKRIHDRYLWIFLHGVIAIVGLALLVFALQ